MPWIYNVYSWAEEMLECLINAAWIEEKKEIHFYKNICNLYFTIKRKIKEHKLLYI